MPRTRLCNVYLLRFKNTASKLQYMPQARIPISLCKQCLQHIFSVKDKLQTVLSGNDQKRILIRQALQVGLTPHMIDVALRTHTTKLVAARNQHQGVTNEHIKQNGLQKPSMLKDSKASGYYTY